MDCLHRLVPGECRGGAGRVGRSGTVSGAGQIRNSCDGIWLILSAGWFRNRARNQAMGQPSRGFESHPLREAP